MIIDYVHASIYYGIRLRALNKRVEYSYARAARCLEWHISRDPGHCTSQADISSRHLSRLALRRHFEC